MYNLQQVADELRGLKSRVAALEEKNAVDKSAAEIDAGKPAPPAPSEPAKENESLDNDAADADNIPDANSSIV